MKPKRRESSERSLAGNMQEARPNQPRQVTAARLRFCLSRTAAVGRRRVTGGVRRLLSLTDDGMTAIRYPFRTGAFAA
jgi:hypothetical protein